MSGVKIGVMTGVIGLRYPALAGGPSGFGCYSVYVTVRHVYVGLQDLFARYQPVYIRLQAADTKQQPCSPDNSDRT